MRLGARWAVGASPHPSVPRELHGTIAEQEQRHAGAGSWTLTWLEGRPRCALDDLVTVTLGAEGGVVIEEELETGDDDDDWLA